MRALDDILAIQNAFAIIPSNSQKVMMKKLFLLFAIFLASCAPAPKVTVPPAARVTVTSTPLPTETPTPTETPLPSPTSITTYTPDQLAGMTKEQLAQLDPASVPTEFLQFASEGGGYDLAEGVVWDKSGLVMWAADAKGEWINYPDGNVPIPPGPGYESEPPLMVPAYHSFNAAMNAITNELPWGEPQNVYRAEKEAANKIVNSTYWKPINENGTWKTSFFDSLNIYASNEPMLEAEVFVSAMQLPGGSIQMRFAYQSNYTGNYKKNILIFGNRDQTYKELKRIDECVDSNRGATDLAELCKSETIHIPAPAK